MKTVTINLRGLAFLIVLAVTTAFLVGLPKSVHADEATSGHGSQIVGEKRDRLIDRSIRNIRTSSGLQVAEASGRVWALDGNTYFVQYRLNDSNAAIASLGLIVDETGSVIESSEVVAKETSHESGHVTVWKDGKREVSQTVTASDSHDSHQRFTAKSSKKGFWGKLNDCLSNAGVASWVIAAAGVACGAACAGTAGAGCVVCLTATAGIATGVASYCVNKAIWS